MNLHEYVPAIAPAPAVPTFAIVLPSGERFSGYTRRQVLDYVSYFSGARIEPPIPPGNPMALDLLDRLCGD